MSILRGKQDERTKGTSGSFGVGNSALNFEFKHAFKLSFESFCNFYSGFFDILYQTYHQLLDCIWSTHRGRIFILMLV